MQETEFKKYVEWLCRIWNIKKDREHTNAEKYKTLF